MQLDLVPLKKEWLKRFEWALGSLLPNMPTDRMTAIALEQWDHRQAQTPESAAAEYVLKDSRQEPAP